MGSTLEAAAHLKVAATWQLDTNSIFGIPYRLTLLTRHGVFSSILDGPCPPSNPDPPTVRSSSSGVHHGQGPAMQRSRSRV